MKKKQQYLPPPLKETGKESDIPEKNDDERLSKHKQKDRSSTTNWNPVQIRRGPATVSLTTPSTTGFLPGKGRRKEDGNPGDWSWTKIYGALRGLEASVGNAVIALLEGVLFF